MVGLNKMLAIGNVGTDPEMRYTPKGDPVTSFRLATGRTYTTSDGERKQETEWFTVVAWSQLAEQCNQYLAKGRRVYVEGRLIAYLLTRFNISEANYNRHRSAAISAIWRELEAQEELLN